MGVEQFVDAGAEVLGVEGGVDLGVVVEVDEDVAGLRGGEVGVDAACGAEVRMVGGGGSAAGPSDDALGPEVKGIVGVVARVELLGAVEAEIDEGGGGVEEERPVGGVGDDQADVVLAEEVDEGGGGEAFVADLDGVAERDVDGSFEDGAREHAVVAALGKPGGVGGGAGEEVEEVTEAAGVEAHLRRELPEDGAELRAEGEEAAGE